MFGSLWSWFAGNSIGSSLAKVAIVGYASKLLSDNVNESSTGQEEVVDEGVRLQLGPDTENKIPVIYGEAYFGGYITDAQLSNDYKKMTYCLTLAELGGYKLSDNNPSTYYFEGVYLNNNRVVFKSDGFTVDYTLDANGNQDISFRDLVKVYFYCDQTGVQPVGSSGSTPDPWTVMPGWTESTHPMEDLMYAVVEVTYNRANGVTGLPDCIFHAENNMTLPGDVLYDYMTNSVYGANIPTAQIDTASLTALNSFASTGFTYRNVNGINVTGQITINGLVDTQTTVLDNMEELAKAASSWLSYDIHTGKWTVIINKAGTAIATLTDSHILGEISVSGTSLTQLNNVANVKYQNTDILDKTDFVKISIPSGDLLPNEPESSLELSLPFTNNQVVATKLGLQLLKQARVDKVIGFKADYSYMQVRAGDIIGVTSSVYGFTNKLFRVISVEETDGDNGEIQLDFKALEYDSDVYVYDITEYAVETDDGILTIGNIGKPNTPTVTKTEEANVPKIVIGAVVPSGIVDAMEFWLTFDVSVGNDSARSYIQIGTYQNNNGTILEENQSINYTYSGLGQGDFYIKVRGVNAQISGPFSDPTGLIEYNPVVVADTLSDEPVSIGGQLMSLGLLTLLNNLDKLFSGDPSTWSIFAQKGDEAGQQTTVPAAVAVKDEGLTKTSGASSINFVGEAVTVTNSGNDVTVTISGTGTGEGGGGGEVTPQDPPNVTPPENTTSGSLSIIGQWPANRSTTPPDSHLEPSTSHKAPATGAYYLKFGPGICSDYVQIALGDGKAQLYKTDGTLVQELTPGQCTVNGNVLRLPFSTRTKGTDYYILMSAGFVKYQSGTIYSQNGSIGQGNWVFNVPWEDITPYDIQPDDPAETVALEYQSILGWKTVGGTALVAEKVNRHTEIYVTFNKAVKLGISGNITINDAGGSQVIDISKTFTVDRVYNLAYGLGSNSIVINPTKDLSKGGTVSVTFGAGTVLDLCGTQSLGQFTTGNIVVDSGPIAQGTKASTDGTASSATTLTYDRAVKAGTGNLQVKTSNGTILSTITALSPAVQFLALVGGATAVIIALDQLGITTWPAGDEISVETEEGFVVESSGAEQPNPASVPFTFTTNASGPLVTGIYPNTIGASEGGAIGVTLDSWDMRLTYNRTQLILGTGDFKLYKVGTGGALDELVYTFDITDTTIRSGYTKPYLTFNGTNRLDFNLTVAARGPLPGEFQGFEPNTQYYFLADAGVFKDVDNFDSAAITNGNTLRMLTADNPYIVTGSPTINEQGVGTFPVTSITMSFNRRIYLVSGATFSLYKEKDSVSTLVKTYTSSEYSLDQSGNQIVFDSVEAYIRDPETKYYMVSSENALYDDNRFETTITEDTEYYFTTYEGPIWQSTGNTPQPGTSNYDNNVFIKLKFDRNVQGGTGKINLRKSLDDSLVKAFDPLNPAEVTFSGLIATVYVRGYLAASTNYYVELEQNSIEDTNGVGCLELIGDYHFYFGTADEIDFPEIRGQLFDDCEMTTEGYLIPYTRTSAALATSTSATCIATRIPVEDILLLTPSNYGYVEDTTGRLIAPTITDFSNTSGTYTIELVPSTTGAYTQLSSTTTGGTFTFNSTTKVLTIQGTKAQVNNRLENINLTPTTDYSSNYTITYNLTTPTNGNESKVQNIVLAEPYDPEVSNLVNARSFTGSAPNNIFASSTPQIIDLDSASGLTYSVTLSSNIGEFGFLSDGSDKVASLTYSGTRAEVNAKTSTVKFWPDMYLTPTGTVTNIGNFTWAQTKNGVQHADFTIQLNKSSDYDVEANEFTGSFATSYYGYSGTQVANSALLSSADYSDNLSYTFTITKGNNCAGLATEYNTADDEYSTDFANSLTFTGTKSEVNAWLPKIRAYPTYGTSSAMTVTVSYTKTSRPGQTYDKTVSMAWISNIIANPRVYTQTESGYFYPTLIEKLYYKMDILLVGAGGGGSNPEYGVSPNLVGSGGGGGKVSYYTGNNINYYSYNSTIGQGGTSGSAGGASSISTLSISASGGQGGTSAAGGANSLGRAGTSSTTVANVPPPADDSGYTYTGGTGAGSSTSGAGGTGNSITGTVVQYALGGYGGYSTSGPYYGASEGDWTPTFGSGGGGGAQGSNYTPSGPESYFASGVGGMNGVVIYRIYHNG